MPTRLTPHVRFLGQVTCDIIIGAWRFSPTMFQLRYKALSFISRSKPFLPLFHGTYQTRYYDSPSGNGSSLDKVTLQFFN
jgi:hypothetical protein